MRQPKIRQRKRRGKVTFICDIGGQQFGLGTDAEQAKARFADLLAKHASADIVRWRVMTLRKRAEANGGLPRINLLTRAESRSAVSMLDRWRPGHVVAGAVAQPCR